MNKVLLIFAIITLPFASKAQTELLSDTSLELTGAGGAQWTSTSTNFATVLCDLLGCGDCTGPCVPHSGTWYAWFGGSGQGVPELGTLDQTFNVTTSGTADLSFWVKLPTSGVAVDSLIAYVDNVPVWHKLGDDSVGFDVDYVQLTVPLGTLATGSHTLNWIGIESGTAATTFNILLDDISIKIDDGVGISDFDFENGVTVFSNNSDKILNCSFSFDQTSTLDITITDMMGRVWRKSHHNNLLKDDVTFSTSGMATGLYNITFNKNGYAFSKKFIIQN